MDKNAEKSSSFFSQWLIVQLHNQARKKIEDFGKEKLLTPEFNKIASNIEIDVTNFPDNITFLPPNDNTKYASEISSKYYILYERAITRIFLPVFFISLFVSCLLVILIFNSIFKYINNPILSDVVFPILMILLTFYPTILLAFSLKAPFDKGYQALKVESTRLETKEWMERIVEQYENEYVIKPDERFEKLKNLSAQKKLELENLIKELTQTEKQRKKYENLFQEYSDLIDQMILRKFEGDHVKNESFKELLKPKPFIRDVLVNISSSFIWFILAITLSFILGVISDNIFIK